MQLAGPDHENAIDLDKLIMLIWTVIERPSAIAALIIQIDKKKMATSEHESSVLIQMLIASRDGLVAA